MLFSTAASNFFVYPSKYAYYSSYIGDGPPGVIFSFMASHCVQALSNSLLPWDTNFRYITDKELGMGLTFEILLNVVKLKCIQAFCRSIKSNNLHFSKLLTLTSVDIRWYG